MDFASGTLDFVAAFSFPSHDLTLIQTLSLLSTCLQTFFIKPSLHTSSMASKDSTPTSLGNISENLDVASAIAAWIQSWSQSAGFQDERNRGRMWVMVSNSSLSSYRNLTDSYFSLFLHNTSLRDSTLRAISLSNKKMRENWHPFLLQQVTITTPTLVSFYRLLERNPKSGELVRSLHFSDQVSNLSEQTMRKCTMEIIPFAKKELRRRPKTQEVMEDAVHNIMNT